MKKQFYTLAVLLVMGFSAEAQVGIGTANPDPSSMLDIASTTKGLLMPRLTTVKRTSIPNPAAGLQVYDTTTKSFWYFDGTVWVNSGASSAQDLRFLGTGNHVSQDAGIGSNGTNLGIGGNIIAIGDGVLSASTTGGSNIGIGASTLKLNTVGNYNTAIGENAMTANINGSANSGIGLQSLLVNTSGSNNSALGYLSLQGNTTGSNNTGVGVQAGNNITTGGGNIAIGAGTAVASPTANNQLNIANNIFGTGLNGSVNAPAGRIGIGTNNPRSLLHAAIDANSYAGQLTVGGKTDQNKAIEIGYNTTTNQGYIQPSWAGTTWSDLLLNPNNGGQGYVGINSQSPHGQLTLGNLVMNRKILLYETANNDHQFYGFGVNSGVLRYQVDNVAADHIFYAGASTTTSNELARIKGNGNVGIGTATPATKLHIAADRPDNTLAQLWITGTDPNKNLSIGYNTTADKAYIQSSHSGVAWTDLMLQPFAGNVGIGLGTTTANHRLTFDGNYANAAKIALVEFGATNSMGLGVAAGQFRLNIGSTSDKFSFLSSETATTDIMTLKGNGELIVTNTITAPRIQGPSDSRFKKNIKPIENALDKVMKLGGYTYDWKDASEFPNQTLGKGHDMGVIAQEVEKQFPEAVTTNADGYKAVSYTELVPALIEAIKTLQAQNQTQQAQIDELKTQITRLQK